MFEHINVVAVLVSALLALAVRNIWYSPLLFGSAWMRSIGMSPDIEERTDVRMLQDILKGVLLYGVFFTLIAELVVFEAFAAIPLWHIAGFLTIILASTTMHAVIWEGRSFIYFLIHTGYSAVILFGGLAIIAFWPW